MTITSDRNLYTVVEPIIPEEDLPEKQVCWLCKNPADKKMTTYGNPDGLLRIALLCNHCIEKEFPHYKTDTADKTRQHR
jgi:hypothetical protein